MSLPTRHTSSPSVTSSGMARQLLPGHAMLQILSASLSPLPTSLRCLTDPILVSIDIGLSYHKCPEGYLDSIGISTLDTRSLFVLRTGEDRSSDAISRRLVRLRPARSSDTKFFFGIPEFMTAEKAKEVLLHTFSQIDEKTSRLRNVLLVGHDIGNDLEYLHDKLDFDLTTITSITAFIDTQRIAREVFNFPKKNLSLHQTLLSLGLTARQLHNSGNDAFYTMQALLRMFSGYQEKRLGEAGNGLDENGEVEVRREEVGSELSWEERIDLLRCVTHTHRRWRGITREARAQRASRVEVPDLLEGSPEDGCMGMIFEGGC